VELYLHTATCPHGIHRDLKVTPLLDGGELQLHTLVPTGQNAGWVPGSQGQYRCFGEEKVFSPCQQQNPKSLDVQPIADSLQWLKVQRFCAVNKTVHTVQKVGNTAQGNVSLQVI
jgi:hypothetical protein